MQRLRQQVGMSQEALGRVIQQSRSQVGRLEGAEAAIPKDVPAKLDACFGTDGHFVRLYGIARHEVHPDQYRRRMELEQRARWIYEYGAHHVPGLLQTEAYAHAVFRSGDPDAAQSVIDDLTVARLNRQALRFASPAPFLSVILDEAVIRRAVGGPEVMREQLEALLPLVDSGTSTVQLMPFSAGWHPLLGGSMTLLTLEDRTTVAYEESINGGTLYEDMESVDDRRRQYDRARAYALSPTDTAAVLRAAMEELSA